MEIHQHSHHGKKSLKEYIFDFFMLFLAIFCATLAEYYLEHHIEKEKGDQYIASFYEDLKNDTGRITTITGFEDNILTALENLPHCYSVLTGPSTDQSCLLNIIKYSMVNKHFTRTERTLLQLSNAGGYRLLPKEDADTILSLEKLYTNFEDYQQTVFQEAQNNVRASFNNLVNFKANAQMFAPIEGKLINSDNFDEKVVKAPVLLFKDKEHLNKYFNELQLYYRVTYNHRKILLDLKERQTELLKYFENKYDL